MYRLNIASVIGTYMFLIGTLFFLLRYTIFNIKILKNRTLLCFYVNDILSLNQFFHIRRNGGGKGQVFPGDGVGQGQGIGVERGAGDEGRVLRAVKPVPG